MDLGTLSVVLVFASEGNVLEPVQNIRQCFCGMGQHGLQWDSYRSNVSLLLVLLARHYGVFEKSKNLTWSQLARLLKSFNVAAEECRYDHVIAWKFTIVSRKCIVSELYHASVISTPLQHMIASKFTCIQT